MNHNRDILLCRDERASDVIAALRPKERGNPAPARKPYEVREYEDDQTLTSYRLAVVRASGVLAREVGGFYGLADLGELASSVEAADADANIDGIILVIDSPGGTVNGTPEAADRIAATDKPVMVWTEGELCSAAYWIAASADYIAAAPSSITASIGCVLAIWDESAIVQAMGLRVHVFRSGDLKAAGYPGTQLSDTEAAHFQARVDEVASDFFNWVMSWRPDLDGALFDGRAISGKMALGYGAVDGLHNTLDDAVAAFAPMLNP